MGCDQQIISLLALAAVDPLDGWFKGTLVGK